MRKACRRSLCPREQIAERVSPCEFQQDDLGIGMDTENERNCAPCWSKAAEHVEFHLDEVEGFVASVDPVDLVLGHDAAATGQVDNPYVLGP